MNPSGNGQVIPFRVIVSAAIRQQIEYYHQRAQHDHKGDAFIKTLEIINSRLRKDPYNLGEPLYRLHDLKLLVCIVVLNDVVVVFGIHQELPIVFLNRFTLLGE